MEDYSVDSGQEEEDEGHGVVAEESQGHRRDPGTLQRGQRVDDDEAGRQNQRTSYTYGNEERLAEVVRQVAHFEGQYCADEYQEQIVHQKRDQPTRWYFTRQFHHPLVRTLTTCVPDLVVYYLNHAQQYLERQTARYKCYSQEVHRAEYFTLLFFLP